MITLSRCLPVCYDKKIKPNVIIILKSHFKLSINLIIEK